MVGTSSFDPTELAKLPKGYLQQDIGDRLIITASVFIVLQTIFVTLFYISRHLTKTLNGLECWLFMPVGYILTTVLCVCGILSVKCGGSGRHVEAVLLQDPQMVINRNKIDKVVEFVYIEAIAGTKLAILCLYLRIFSTRSYRIATYLVGALIILTVIGAHICSLVICSPIAFQWNPTIPGGHCGNLMLAYQMWCIPNIATDVMMLVLPLPAIFKLRIDMAVKIGLTITFLTGSGGIIMSILRMNTFIGAAELFKDPTYKCIPTFVFNIIEAGTYTIAACMPTLRPLKARLLPNHSFTKLIDRTLSACSIRTTHNFSGASYHKGGVLRTTQITLDTNSKGGDDLEFQLLPTTGRNDG